MDETTTQTCQTCGALVGDAEKHATWHAEEPKRAAKAASDNLRTAMTGLNF